MAFWCTRATDLQRLTRSESHSAPYYRIQRCGRLAFGLRSYLLQLHALISIARATAFQTSPCLRSLSCFCYHTHTLDSLLHVSYYTSFTSTLITIVLCLLNVLRGVLVHCPNQQSPIPVDCTFVYRTQFPGTAAVIHQTHAVQSSAFSIALFDLLSKNWTFNRPRVLT